MQMKTSLGSYTDNIPKLPANVSAGLGGPLNYSAVYEFLKEMKSNKFTSDWFTAEFFKLF